jgi:hypothetical protein
MAVGEGEELGLNCWRKSWTVFWGGGIAQLPGRIGHVVMEGEMEGTHIGLFHPAFRIGCKPSRRCGKIQG